jgi:L-amino acid N-acyltransferase YncA
MIDRQETVALRDAGPTDVGAIVEIYNESVVSSTASFDLTPRTPADYEVWFAAHGGRYPVIVAEEYGTVVGWASLSRWSDRAAYDGTAEASLYVRRTHQGRGIGRRLFEVIIERGRAANLHTIISRIAEGNDVSVKLHESHGFTHIGVMQEVGQKFGKYLDVVMMQLIFDGKQEGRR